MQAPEELLRRTQLAYERCSSYADSGTEIDCLKGQPVVRVRFHTAFSRNPEQFFFSYRSDELVAQRSVYEEITRLEDVPFQGARSCGALLTIVRLLHPPVGSRSVLRLRDVATAPSEAIDGEALAGVTGFQTESGTRVTVHFDNDGWIRRVAKAGMEHDVSSLFLCRPIINNPINWADLARAPRENAAPIRQQASKDVARFGLDMAAVVTALVGIAARPLLWEARLTLFNREIALDLRQRIRRLTVSTGDAVRPPAYSLIPFIRSVTALDAQLARALEELEPEISEELIRETRVCLARAGIDPPPEGWDECKAWPPTRRTP